MQDDEVLISDKADVFALWTVTLLMILLSVSFSVWVIYEVWRLVSLFAYSIAS
jgi:hypothetical protein